MKFGLNAHKTLLSMKITFILMSDHCLLAEMDANRHQKFSKIGCKITL